MGGKEKETKRDCRAGGSWNRLRRPSEVWLHVGLTEAKAGRVAMREPNMKYVRMLRKMLWLFMRRPRRGLKAMRGLRRYLRDWVALEDQAATAQTRFVFGKPCPCVRDWGVDSGQANGHYFHQDLLVARRIYQAQPVRHLDVGSRVDGFVAHVAAFRPIDVLDIRPQESQIPNVRFLQADLMTDLPPGLVACCDSLSCLHAIEHFGLGRYGDPICYDGHLVGLANLRRLLKPGGRLYLSTPIGPQRIEFNAHRVFSVAGLLACFEGAFRLDRFSYVDDDGALHENVAMTPTEAQRSFGCEFGCGVFELTANRVVG